MKTSTFDIFDTCLVRKCGTPENMLDVLSLRVFRESVGENVRQSFVVERHKAELRQWEANPYVSLLDIYQNMQFAHPLLYPIEKLIEIETQLEDELLVPVLEVRNKIDTLRGRGHHIIYISDMYLPYGFVYSKMKQCGFIKEGDSLYVSNKAGARKSDGELYKHIHDEEKLSYSHWHHYGDDYNNDYVVPSRFGIKAHKMIWDYNPYPQKWKDSDFSIGYKFQSILAGLSRALSVSNEDGQQRDFVLDIIAPFYCSWVYIVLQKANEQGVKRLYFCARDAHMIYRIALSMSNLFPNIELKYLFISRQSLYNGNQTNRIKYFEQEGLATREDHVAIVDTTTGGTTMKVLNEELAAHGYRKVDGFYYQLWNKIEEARPFTLQTMVYDDYVKLNRNFDRFFQHYFIYENFFALNCEEKTIDYAIENGMAKPVLSNQIDNMEIIVKDKDKWVHVREHLFDQYATSFIQLGLGRYAHDVFNQIVVPTMASFMKWPIRYYLFPLVDFYSCFESNIKPIPCIKKQPLLKLFFKWDRTYYWRRGTIVISTPKWMIRLYELVRKQL